MSIPEQENLSPEAKRVRMVWMVCLTLFAVAMVLVPVAFFVRQATHKTDMQVAAGQLDADVLKARAAGVPLVAADLDQSPPVDDSENAAPLITQAIKEYKAIPNSSKFSSSLRNALLDGNDSATKSLLKEADLPLKTAELAALRPKCDFHRDWDMGPNLLLPEESYIKNFIRAFSARALIKAKQGDHAGAVKDLETGRRLAVDSGSDLFLISLLVQSAGEAVVLGTAERCMAEAKSPDDIQKYVSFLSVKRPPYDTFHVLKSESYTGVTIFRNMKVFGDFKSLSTGGPSGLPAMDPAKLVRSGMPKEPDARAYMARHLEMWTDILNQAQPVANDPVTMFDRAQKISDSIANNNADSYVFEKILSPIYSNLGDSVLTAQARWAVEQALAAVLLYKAQHGAYPKTLMDAGVAASDPFTGKPLLYRVSSSGVLVYSVGRDGIDNKGQRRKPNFGGNSTAYDEVASYPPAPVAPPLPPLPVKP